AVRLPVPPVADEAPNRDADLTFDETLARGGRGATGDDVVALEERAGADREGAAARTGGQGGERATGQGSDRAAVQGGERSGGSHEDAGVDGKHHGAAADAALPRGRDGDGGAGARVATSTHGDTHDGAPASTESGARPADDDHAGTHA